MRANRWLQTPTSCSLRAAWRAVQLDVWLACWVSTGCTASCCIASLPSPWALSCSSQLAQWEHIRNPQSHATLTSRPPSRSSHKVFSLLSWFVPFFTPFSFVPLFIQPWSPLFLQHSLSSCSGHSLPTLSLSIESCPRETSLLFPFLLLFLIFSLFP